MGDQGIGNSVTGKFVACFGFELVPSPEHRSSVLYAGCRKGQTPCPIRLLMPIEPTKIAGLLNFRFAAGSMTKWGSVSCQMRTVTVTIQISQR
jgi:hypothetical protein